MQVQRRTGDFDYSCVPRCVSVPVPVLVPVPVCVCACVPCSAQRVVVCVRSRWDSIGADEEDEDPNLANLDPKQREAMKAKVKNMESMLQAMRAGDSAGVSARLSGGTVGEAPAARDHDDPAIAALIAEPAVKALLDRCVLGTRACVDAPATQAALSERPSTFAVLRRAG